MQIYWLAKLIENNYLFHLFAYVHSLMTFQRCSSGKGPLTNVTFEFFFASMRIRV